MVVLLDAPELILAVSRADPSGELNLVVHRSMDDALNNWGASTRCSPIYPLNGSKWPAPHHPLRVWFVGPVFPGNVPAGVTTFLSLGIYNVILVAISNEEAAPIATFLQSHPNVPWEQWDVSAEGAIKSTEYASHLVTSDTVVTANGPIDLPAGLRSMAEEYRTLVAATIAKAQRYLPEVAREIEQFNQGFRPTLESPKYRDVSKTQWLVNVNAALSRFSSQTFAGISPITGTECHYWTHSLLGVGLAAQGLISIRRQVQRAFDKADFRRRLRALQNVRPNTVRLERLEPSDGFWQRHHLPKDLPESHSRQLTPIVCFSGRDGFRSTTHTLSVPLEVISAANTVGWTLRTVTHELSHVFVDAILGTLLPSLDDVAAANRLVELMERAEPANMYEQVQAFLCYSLCVVDGKQQGDTLEVRSGSELVDIVMGTYPEVSEIVTHIFDFMYFYHRDPTVYIPAIWASWDVIPNIVSRIDEYLLRTLSAVLVLHLTADDPQQRTMDVVLDELTKLKDRLPDANIIHQAVRTLDEEAGYFRTELTRVINLVTLANAFLYSTEVAGIIAARAPRASRTATREFTPKRFVKGEQVANALNFVYQESERTGLTNEPDFQKSAWMMAQLAFAQPRDDDE